jgi:H/ACA ribonucleoprotein complex subunit 4
MLPSELKKQEKKELLTKKEYETNPSYGSNPDERKTEEIINYGVVNIDKPEGPTSHQVSFFVQEILGIERSGHAGTLDPRVTGVLPVTLGKATRIVEYLLKAGKEYVCLMHIHKSIPEEKIREVMDKFIGKINQLPPKKSSVKRQERERTIYYLEILEIEGQDILFKVGTQAGTYIRKLCHDMGQRLEVGAHMSELRRTKAATFDESTLATLHELKDAFHYYKNGNDKFLRKLVQPVEKVIEYFPKIYVIDTSVDSLCHGSTLKIPGISKLDSNISKNDIITIMTLKNELIGMGIALMSTEEIKEKNKGIAAKMDKVFMQVGLYPKLND